MFKVFLGSTFKDLHEHRAAVQAAINRRDDCKAVVMEEFGARAGQPKEVCLEIAEGSDLYVGLIGHCYGHVPDGEAISITEAEYEAARGEGAAAARVSGKREVHAACAHSARVTSSIANCRTSARVDAGRDRAVV